MHNFAGHLRSLKKYTEYNWDQPRSCFTLVSLTYQIVSSKRENLKLLCVHRLHCAIPSYQNFMKLVVHLLVLAQVPSSPGAWRLLWTSNILHSTDILHAEVDPDEYTWAGGLRSTFQLLGLPWLHVGKRLNTYCPPCNLLYTRKQARHMRREAGGPVGWLGDQYGMHLTCSAHTASESHPDRMPDTTETKPASLFIQGLSFSLLLVTHSLDLGRLEHLFLHVTFISVNSFINNPHYWCFLSFNLYFGQNWIFSY